MSLYRDDIISTIVDINSCDDYPNELYRDDIISTIVDLSDAISTHVAL